MQQFVVPQFIDVEGKIIGPITTRQFVLMLAGGLLIFLTFKFLSFTIFIFSTVFIVIFVVIFGFVKVNSRPIHKFIINVMKTIFGRPLLRAWKREVKVSKTSLITDMTKKKETPDELTSTDLDLKPLVRSRLSELSLIVDTGGVYNEEEAIF